MHDSTVFQARTLDDSGHLNEIWSPSRIVLLTKYPQYAGLDSFETIDSSLGFDLFPSIAQLPSELVGFSLESVSLVSYLIEVLN
jgi:hypothetical protein